jgi:hypothetical protein
MSQFRLARISLLLAAIGLNAAFVPAFAQDKPAAPAEAPKDSVRPELFKLVDPAQIKPLMDAKNYAEVKSRLAQADALPNKTPYEDFVLNRMRISLASATSDNATLTTALEAVINSGKLSPTETRDFVLALANQYYNSKDYAKAITWFKRYETETGDNKVHQYIVRAYYFNNDFATAKTELLKDLETNQKAGKQPALEELQLLANTGAKTKDQATYLLAMENLVRYYPNDDYWQDLLSRTQGKSSYSNRFTLDILRLQKVATSKMVAEDYTAMAELALLAGQPIEAKQALDAGFSNGVLGTGANGAQHKKLRAQADKQAADDQKNIGTGEASARKSKNGTGLINLGYAYVTLGEYDKGGLPNAEDAKLRLGYSYAMAGKKDEAIQTLQGVTGTDGRGDLARYWTLWVNRPAGGAAPAVK